MLCALTANAQNIYTPYREFVFVCRYHEYTTDKNQQVDTTEDVRFYVSMWATDSAWEADATQRQLFYAYHDRYDRDSLATAWPYKEKVESTGIIENKKTLWLHPPRWNRLALLEYFPFPEIEKNIKCGRRTAAGNKYHRMFVGHVDFLNKFKIIRYKMEVKYCENNDIWIEGKTKGWSERICFNEEKGFFEMQFDCKGSQIQLSLIDIVNHNKK